MLAAFKKLKKKKDNGALFRWLTDLIITGEMQEFARREEPVGDRE